MKVLTICRGGFVRSACCRDLLHGFGHDVIACGAEYNTAETIAHLCGWADHVVIMQPQFMGVIPEGLRHKTFIYDVGPDIWYDPFHPDLKKIVLAHIHKHDFFTTNP